MQEIESSNNIERLLDVEMNVTVRFGKTEMPLKDVVNFGVGSMIELNRTVDEPVELLVNNFLFARGEVVVIDGYYGVRVTEIGSPEERKQTLFSDQTSKKSNEAEVGLLDAPLSTPLSNPEPEKSNKVEIDLPNEQPSTLLTNPKSEKTNEVEIGLLDEPVPALFSNPETEKSNEVEVGLLDAPAETPLSNPVTEKTSEVE